MRLAEKFDWKRLSFKTLQEVFDSRVSSRGLWTPRYPDLTPCDLHLLASLKKKFIKQSATLRKNYETISTARL
jgi:hypothetical protein